jgi:Tfp pilus assembly protein PilE
LKNENQDKGLGIVDTLFVCTLVGILIAITFHYCQRVVLEARRVALRAELQNIRTAINAYRARHDNRKPESLRTLITEKYFVQKDAKDPQARPFERHYLQVYALDKEAYPIDFFGNRYRYDPKTGDAVSGTAGYESW